MVERLTVVVLALLLGLTACSDDDEPSSTPTTEESTTTSAVGTTATSTTTSTGEQPGPGEAVVQVYFLDQDAFEIGRPPYVVPVERVVDDGDLPAGAMDALFAGPTAEEGAAGLTFVASEATGWADLRIEGGTAHVRLTGGCSSGGSTFTIAEEIAATLRQFEDVDAVKVYDPDGGTEAPDEPGDSIPFCLEP